MVRRTRTIAERNNESSRRRATKSEEKDEPKERGEERSIEVETRHETLGRIVCHRISLRVFDKYRNSRGQAS